MKHDFEARKGHKKPLNWSQTDESPTELAIQRLSRLAGPVALIAGYLAIYAAWRYFFT